MVSAQDNPCVKTWFFPRLVHLGDNTAFKHIPLAENPLAYEINISLKARVKHANISFYTRVIEKPHRYPTFFVNGNAMKNPCFELKPDRWYTCSFNISNDFFIMKTNQITFTSEKLFSISPWINDYAFKNVLLTTTYADCHPLLTVSKSFSKKKAYVGDIVNISIIITNVGILNALNVSLIDDPSVFKVVDGQTKGFLELMAYNNVYLLEYRVNTTKAGDITPKSGTVKYSDVFGNEYDAIIPGLQIRVDPIPPRLYVLKNISTNKTYPGEKVYVDITVVNNGTEIAYNVTIDDFINNEKIIINGSSDPYLDMLLPGENITYQYYMISKEEILLTSAALIHYTDYIGNSFNITSTYTDLTVMKEIKEKSSNPYMILLVLVVGILLLLIVYSRIR